MKKNNQLVTFISIALVLVAFVGCKKQVSTLEEPKADMVQPEKVPEPVIPVDTSDEVTFSEAELDAEFQKKVDENLLPIYFEYNSFSLTQNSIEKLGVAATFMRDNPGVRILIEGNCDERGSSEYNMGLGENRAKVVKEYMANYGIDNIRMEITSWGKERPVQSGCTDETCHSQNRRAEYKVLAR